MKNPSKSDQSTLSSSINLQLSDCYNEACKLLCESKSYLKNPNLDNIVQYLNFVNAALERPYNRMIHLAAFIRDEDGLMSSRMYPFSLLTPDIKVQIQELYKKAEHLAASLELSGDQQSYKLLEREPDATLTNTSKGQLN